MTSRITTFFLSSLLVGVLPMAAQASSNKLDLQLQRDLALSQQAKVAANSERAPRQVHSEWNTSVLIQLADEADVPAVIAQLTSMGVQISTRTGHILTAQMPGAKIAAVAALSTVQRLEAPRPLPSRLMNSVPATEAPSLRTGDAPQWQGLTGKGVIVGVVDDGFDFRHPSLRNADGTTRILALWNQRQDAVGSAPSGFSYGGVCTVEMINAAIAQAEANQTVTACTQPSKGGHGTHVASIAAGNGADTGEFAYRHVGMAPEADLVLVNGIGEGADPNLETDRVIDAIAFIRDQAKAHNKKAVVNLSLGSYYGARDGTSVFEQALDSFVLNDGLLIVGSAGNEGDAPIRTGGTLTAGQSVSFDLIIPTGLEEGAVEVWYSGNSRYRVSLEGPNSCGDIPVIDAPGADQSAEIWEDEMGCGYVGIASSSIYTNNGDRLIELRMFDETAFPLATGTWKLTLTALEVSGESQFDMVVANYSGDIEISGLTGVTEQILTDVASATHVIGVASYNTNNSWDSQVGPIDSDLGNGVVGDISTFSSRGPRRDCSDLSKCPAVMKPEITAPGSYIMAAKAHDYDHSDYPEEISPSGNYVVFSGTSMASPHVAGAAALLWQSFPTETATQLRARLLGNTKRTDFTPVLLPEFSASVLTPEQPDYTWGYGVLAVDQAVNASEPDVEEPKPNTGNPDNGGRKSSGGGCSLAVANGSVDPTLPLIVILSALAVGYRRRIIGEAA